MHGQSLEKIYLQIFKDNLYSPEYMTFVYIVPQGGYLGRLPLRTPTPLKYILWPIIDPS